MGSSRLCDLDAVMHGAICFFYIAETQDAGRVAGDIFTLSYNGTMCTSAGLLIHTLSFDYHMLGASIGELRVIDDAGATRWSLGGSQGKEWLFATMQLYTSAFRFEYVRGA
eukprot:786107-Prymnesium_polylepis.1